MAEPTFSHHNVAQLLKMINMDYAKLHVMQHQLTTLYDIFKWKTFIRRFFSLNTYMGRIQDILSGLSYLHSMKLCHLDVKSNHAFIRQGMRTAVGHARNEGHFSYLNTTKKLVQR